MKFDVYCDESRPDLLSSSKADGKYMLIGSLWMPTEKRGDFKQEIHALRDKHKVGAEFKWQKVSPSRMDFYVELVRWFFEKSCQLRFRCIAVDHAAIDLKLYHDDDQELGFYKFYYQLLHHWIYDFNDYSIFVDCKTNRCRGRLVDLKRCLEFSNLTSIVDRVQAVHSNESVLIQLTDVLTGLAGYKLNMQGSESGAKFTVLRELEKCLCRQIGPTNKSEPKFNIFNIKLGGGW